MRKTILVVVVGILATSIMPVTAQVSNQQQGGYVLVPKSMLSQAQVEALETKQELENLGEYAGLGKEIGEAINYALEAVTENAQKFSETDPGRLTMYLVFWKVAGEDLMGYVIGIP